MKKELVKINILFILLGIFHYYIILENYQSIIIKSPIKPPAFDWSNAFDWVGPLTLFFNLYLIPTWIVAFRKIDKRKKNIIYIINFLLGWTFIGWIIALIWAVSSKPKSE